MVASDTRGPGFETSHQSNYLWYLFTVKKTKIKFKRPIMAKIEKQQMNTHAMVCSVSKHFEMGVSFHKDFVSWAKMS